MEAAANNPADGGAAAGMGMGMGFGMANAMMGQMGQMGSATASAGRTTSCARNRKLFCSREWPADQDHLISIP